MSLSLRVSRIVAAMLGPALRAHEDRILAAMSKKIADSNSPIAHEGIVMPGSFDPTDGTAEILIGDTYGLIGDDGDLPATLKRVPLLSTMVGDLAAPIGGERVILHRDFGAILHHGEDDSPGGSFSSLPSLDPGERLIAHRNPATLKYDSYRHMTNDGSNPGDGLGGTRDLVGAYVQQRTAGGHTITADDTVEILSIISAGGLSHALNDATGQIIHTAGAVVQTLDKAAVKLTHAAGPVYTLFDGNGGAISHVASSVGVGALASTLAAGNAAIHNAHLTSFKSSIMSDMMQSFASVFSTAMQTAGIPNAAAFHAIVAAAGWIIGNITPPTVPSGSSIVKIAN